MKTKEKAEELVDKIYFDIDYTLNNKKIVAKRCAIICVDEIIELLYKLSDCSNLFVDEIDYYQRVKQEIVNL
jgi:hypothetical protein